MNIRFCELPTDKGAVWVNPEHVKCFYSAGENLTAISLVGEEREIIVALSPKVVKATLLRAE